MKVVNSKMFSKSVYGLIKGYESVLNKYKYYL